LFNAQEDGFVGKALEKVKYVVFETAWGYFGLAAGGRGILRTSLPTADGDSARTRLLAGLAGPGTPNAKKCVCEGSHFAKSCEMGPEPTQYDENLHKSLQEKVKAYFDGNYIEFGSNVEVDLTGFSEFGRTVLLRCREIRPGQTLSYSQLAKKAGRPTAARAVGNILAKNPLPLIIPCHRVVCSNGKIGGFSAMAGAALKERMLRMEARTVG